MADESVTIPGKSVEEAAAILARLYRWFAIIPFAIAAFLSYTFVSYHAKRGFPHGVGTALFTLAITVGLPIAAGIWPLAKARRIARVGAAARSHASLTWHLAGAKIVAADNGALRPELSFAVTASLRRMLTAVPRATVR